VNDVKVAEYMQTFAYFAEKTSRLFRFLAGVGVGLAGAQG
jgi:hypothetical protein